MTESWRKLPENPEYELSNRGRLRGPGGLLCMPGVSVGSARKAKYAVPVGRDRNSTRARVLVSDMMMRVWKVKFEPTAQWVSTVRSEVLAALERRKSARRKEKARYVATRRAKAPAPDQAEALPVEGGVNDIRGSVSDDTETVSENRAPVIEPLESVNDDQVEDEFDELAAEASPDEPDDEAGNVLDSVEELWRPVPDHPRYQLSNRGRMRGYMGLLLKPHLNGASALSAKYQLWSSAPFKRSASFSIRQGMLVVWGIRFTPTVEWVKEVQAQVLEEATSRIRERKPVVEQKAQVCPSPAVAVPPAKAPSAPSRPSGGSGGDGMPCPWASGKLDRLPPGVATWRCPEMDPMTDHGRCRVWVCVPEQSELQRSGVAA